ncbi:MAG TPA: TonB-dependent receptor [Mariniphaga sp.]|nr:TonB-dependent receptor [Mariniphaga sp.]
MIKRLFLYVLLILASMQGYAQSSNATIRGTVIDQNGEPIDMVNIGLKDYPLGTSSNREGRFLLRVPAKREIILIFSALGYLTVTDTLLVNANEPALIEIVMPATDLQLSEITIIEHQRANGSVVRIDPKFLNVLPDAATGGVEALLKTLPGVSTNNELSSQYTVRGGNFDENLVYVNDIEIYRPFLIRAGQQEGLSFINSDLVSAIDFSAGGFQARYGDKMSSVLDIKYRKPSDFRGSASASLLGATAHFEDVTINGRLTHISGIRYKTNRYLLGSLDEQGDYNPQFMDFQTFITYQFSPKFDVSFLGNASQNQYQFIPQTRRTTFGTWNIPLNTSIYFQGQEIDKFNTYLGALSANYHPNLNLNLKFILSAFNTSEQETYDILGQYYLNQLERNMSSEEFGDSILNLGVGTFLNHARNYLDAGVFSFAHKGAYNSETHLLNWGIKFQHERFSDKLNEWIYRDSTGYSLPYSDSHVQLYYSLSAKNKLSSNRITGYLQDTWSLPLSTGDLYLTGGLRANYWSFNNELLISPRASVSYYPQWKNKVSFSLSGGIYYQSPLFKDLKNLDGSVNYQVRAQRSYQVIAGADYLFSAWSRPFRFTTETYYKSLDRLIPYQIDNVQIRYRGEQQSKGYATGIDMKINGEFVSGLQSWASLSLMKTEENVIGDAYGYLPRPTDQLLNFSLFFQDYLPGNPTYKMQLSGFYGSRLPTIPFHTQHYHEVFRMPPYRRIDLGISKILISPTAPGKNNFFKHIDDMWVSLEVFNLLNINNTISYFWVSSNYGDQFAVPNYLTGRKINLKLSIGF